MSKKAFSYAESARRSASEVLELGFYNFEPAWVSEAAFAHLMINMKDLCQILAINGHRISFKDDVPPDRDVTDLVTDMRNAICHIGSPLRRFGKSFEVSFCTAIGKCVVGQFGDVLLENPYEDDVAFFYGIHKIYLKRHIYRALEESKIIIVKKFQDEDWFYY